MLFLYLEEHETSILLPRVCLHTARQTRDLQLIDPVIGFHRLQIAFKRVLTELIPPPHLRKPLTWRTLPSAFAYVIPFYFLAYLARRRDTRLIRLLLLPTIVVTALRGTFNYSWDLPAYAFPNWFRGMICSVTILICDADTSLQASLVYP